MGNNKVTNLETFVDHKVDGDYDTIVEDLKSAVNKEYLNAKFLKKDKDDNYFDLRQNVIKNTEPYYLMGYLETVILYQKFSLTQRYQNY